MRSLRGLFGILALVLAGLFVAPAPTASACSCAQRTAAEIVSGADVVLVGTSVKTWGTTVGDGGSGRAHHAVAVNEVYRGSAHTRALVNVPTMPEQCSPVLTDDESTLIAADRGRSGLVVKDVCIGANAPTARMLAQVRRETGPAHAPRAGSDPELVAFEKAHPPADQRRWPVAVGAAVVVFGLVLLGLYARRRTGARARLRAREPARGSS